MDLGYETGRGNVNAFSDVFSEEPADEDEVREGERCYEDEARESVLNEEARIAMSDLERWKHE